MGSLRATDKSCALNGSTPALGVALWMTENVGDFGAEVTTVAITGVDISASANVTKFVSIFDRLFMGRDFIGRAKTISRAHGVTSQISDICCGGLVLHDVKQALG